MLLSNSESEKLFSKPVPVSLKDVHTNLIRPCHLFLSMEWEDASAGMYSRKVLVITLTDNNDPFFLYNLHLSEEDFEKLKTSQELLINFASFPQHIIGYIEKCLFEEKNSQPKFLLLFSINEKFGNIASSSQFDIIETNQFKNLTHLSLQFVAASESVIKQYISTYFRKLKEENRQLQSNLVFSEQDKKDKLAAKELALHNKEQELEILRKESNAELAMKDSRHSQELQEEKNRLLEKLREEESRFERERKEKDHQFRKEIQQLEKRINALETLNKELQDKNFKHESTIRELRSTVLSLEDEIKRTKDNIQSYQLKCESLQSEIKDKKSHINNLDEIINELQKEIRNKVQLIVKLNQQIESEIRQKKSLEVEMEDVKLQLDISEKTRKILDKEKEELDEMLVSLQEKTRKTKSKIELAAKYKQTIDEKEKLLQDVKKETSELNAQLKDKNSEVKSLMDEVNIHKEKINDLENDLKTKQNIINWMSRTMTENNIFSRYTPESNLNTSPSAIAQKQLAKISHSAGHISSNPDYSPSIIASSKIPTKSVRRNVKEPCLASGDFGCKNRS